MVDRLPTHAAIVGDGAAVGMHPATDVHVSESAIPPTRVQAAQLSVHTLVGTLMVARAEVAEGIDLYAQLSDCALVASKTLSVMDWSHRQNGRVIPWSGSWL